MEVRRREFLEGAVAGAGGLLLGGASAATKPGRSANLDPYEKVALGKSGLSVTRVGLGTGVRAWMRRSNHTRMGPKRFDALVRAAYERGIRLFGTADLYGTHTHLARALAKVRRDTYTLVTKVWLHAEGLPEAEPPAADTAVERFLKELKTDHLDLVLLHGVADGDWAKLRADEMARLTALKKKGVIRALGVSVHSLAAMRAAVGEPWAQVVYVRINPSGVSMGDKPAKVVPVLKKLAAAGKGVVAMKVLGAGKLAKTARQRDASIRFVLGLGCVDALTIGFETPAEIDDLAARVRRVRRPASGARQ